jgi:phenylalanyl-tRNA synthetase beta chain
VRIRRSVLSRFIEVPREARALRDLLDDLGLEVKRLDELPGDIALTLELLANRGDHHGYLGLAREIGGRTGGVVRVPEYQALIAGPSPVPLRVETPLCPVYTATLLVREHTGDLHEEDLAPLIAADMNRVSAAVDATNIVALEFGQPTHTFDADTVVGGLIVRTSGVGERAWPLFTNGPVELPPGTLVIADDEKILAVAGVIGCHESRTTEQTRRILVESAHFDPVSVRKAARALGLSTDASTRFERGTDPSVPLVAAGRVAALLQPAGWRATGTTGVAGAWRDPNRQILLSVPAAASYLEIPLGFQEVRVRLGRYGFLVSPDYPDWEAEEGWRSPEDFDEVSRDRLRASVLVRVPPHRLFDVEEAADLYEELAKSVGYASAPERLPPITLGSLPSPREERKAAIDTLWVGHGFYEVILDGFHARDLHDRLGLPPGHPLHDHIETQNALDRGYSLLKNSALPQALDGLATNLNVRQEQVKAYEWTRTFHPDKTAANGVCRERPVFWALAAGAEREPGWAHEDRPVDVWYLKGILENMALDLHLPLKTAPLPADDGAADLLHPGRRAAVYLGDQRIGALGEVHPTIVAAFKIKRARPLWLELDADVLLGAPASVRRWDMPGERQAIDRDLAFTLPLRVEAGDVARTLRHAGPPWLEAVSMTDLFAHEDAGSPVRTVTFSLRFSTEDQARTAVEVNTVCEHLIEAVHGMWGSRGVKLRA